MKRPSDTAERSLPPHGSSQAKIKSTDFDPLARMMAHEVRNLLTPMRVKAQMALDHPENSDRTRKALQWAINSVLRISAITDTILLGSTGTISPIPIRCVLEELCESLPLHNGNKPRVSLEVGAELSVISSPEAVRHIVLNLLLNAVRASTAKNGNVHVTGSRSTWNTGGTPIHGISIVIEDDGRGLDDSTLSRLNGFTQENQLSLSDHSQPNNSQTPSVMSPAVGLFVVEKLIRMVDGEIHALNMPVGGARIAIRLPDLKAASGSVQSRAA